MQKGNTALHIAVLANKMDFVKFLIENGAQVNVQSQLGFTPLYMAAQEHFVDMVDYLIAQGADPNIACNVSIDK